MGLMDKVRAQGAQLAQMAQETAREGKVKLDQAQAKRRADAMFRDLGATVYAERTGRGSPDSAAKIDRLVDALSRQEAEQGFGEPDSAQPAASTPPSAGQPAGSQAGGQSAAGEPPGGQAPGGQAPGSPTSGS